MKKFVSLLLAAVMLLGLMGSTTAALADDTPTLRVFIVLHTEQTAEAKDLFFFKYLSKLYNVNFEIESMKSSDDVESKLATMWSDLPDLVLHSATTDIVMKYGVDQGVLLDFAPYLTEEYMPNAVKAREEYGSAFDSAFAPDGGLYALPYIRGYVYANNTGAFTANERVNINTRWLEAVGMEKPTSLDELIDVLRAFKEKDPDGLGDKLIPAIDNQSKLKEMIWNSLGFYGGGNQTWGTAFAIRNNELVLPAYTQEAKLFIETVKTLYDEGLVSPDYFTLDSDTNRALISQGVCGVYGDSTQEPSQATFQDWDVIAPLSSSINDIRVATVNLPVQVGSYASADTKYPELVAKISDWFYSEEGAMMYQMGPMKGSEAEAMVEGANGWYIKDGVVVNALTDPDSDLYDPTYTLTNGNTGFYYIGGKFDVWRVTPFEVAGEEVDIQYYESTDVLTGAKISMMIEDPNIFKDDNWDYHWRVTQTEANRDYLTFIRLPGVMLSAEDTERVNFLKTSIEDYITSQTAEFITGRRSLDEFDAYLEELQKLNIEEYIGIYEAAYANFFETTFGE